MKPEAKIGFMKLVNAIFNKYLKDFSLQFIKYFLKSWLFFEYVKKLKKNILFLFFLFIVLLIAILNIIIILILLI